MMRLVVIYYLAAEAIPNGILKRMYLKSLKIMVGNYKTAKRTFPKNNGR
jgi:hypothetical protein